jgi:hypothetical protein
LPLAVGPAMRATGGRILAIADADSSGRLDERLLEERSHASWGPAERWIDRGDAADIRSRRKSRSSQCALRAGKGIDVIAHPPGPREKRLLSPTWIRP